jgi:hypothetical protein
LAQESTDMELVLYFYYRAISAASKTNKHLKVARLWREIGVISLKQSVKYILDNQSADPKITEDKLKERLEVNEILIKNINDLKSDAPIDMSIIDQIYGKHQELIDRYLSSMQTSEKQVYLEKVRRSLQLIDNERLKEFIEDRYKQVVEQLISEIKRTLENADEQTRDYYQQKIRQLNETLL